MELDKQYGRIIYLSVFVIIGAILLTILYRGNYGSLLSLGKQRIKGKVISLEGEPIPDALVAVESGNFDGPGNPNPTVVRTDSFGGFEVHPRDQTYRLTVWKQGYAENGCNNINCMRNGVVTIRLRKVDFKQTLPTIDHFYDLADGGAFSFRRGTNLKMDDPQADVFIKTDLSNPEAIISAPTNGGIALADGEEFDNAIVAPEVYQDSVKINFKTMSTFFVKTQNGDYAKFRIIPDLIISSDGRKSLDFSNCRLIWAFQPDGSRNLETVSAQPPALFSENATSIGN